MDFSQLSEDDKALAVQLLEKHREQQKNINENFLIVVNDWCGFELNEEQHEKLWSLVENEIDEDILYGMSYSGMGTSLREEIMRIISNVLAGMDWPLYGDSKEYKEKFQHNIQKGLAKIGYTEPYSLD